MKKIDLAAAEEKAFRGRLGAVCSPKKTVFRLWQPFAEKARVRLFNARGELLLSAEMTRRGGVFEYECAGDCEGFLYDFSVTDGGCERVFADVYAVSVTADGKFGVVTDMRRNAPEGFENEDFLRFDCPEKAVICEVSVRDFSMDRHAKFASRGKFPAFCEDNVTNTYGDEVGLSYIKNLGVTHIQLMPIFDFDPDGSEYNWGYNPRFCNAPSSGYSLNNAIYELRALVSAAHRMNLGVIADVVYNHVYSALDSSFEKQLPGYFFRGSGGFSNGSGCGNETASERLMMRKFIIDSLVFLMNEYRLDGFRFDLMGLLDVGTMRVISERLRRINPSVLLYGEGWTGGESPLPERLRAVRSNSRALPQIGFFNDSFRDAVKGNVFAKKDCGFVNGKADDAHFEPIFSAISGEFQPDFWTGNPAQTINYVECHDNLTLFDKLEITLGSAASERVLSADRMAAAFVFLSCGAAFFQCGQEFLRSKKRSENSYNLPDSVNSIKWNGVTKYSENVDYYRGLIAFRKRFYGVFRGCRRQKKGGAFLLSAGDFFMIINPTDAEISADLDGEFEIFIDEHKAASTPLYRKSQLNSAGFGVVVARRTDDEV